MVPGATAAPVSTSTMRTSTDGKGRPQLPCLSGRKVGVERVGRVGPERLGHAEQVRAGAGRAAVLGREHGVEAARLQRRQVGAGERRVGGERDGLLGPAPEQRHLLALEERQRARRLGLGLAHERRAGDERGEEPAAEAAHPEERHRDVEAVAVAEAPRAEALLDRAERAAVRVDHALGRAAAARREHHHHVVGRSHRRVEAGDERGVGRGLGRGRVRARRRPSATVRRRGSSARNCACPRSTSTRAAGAIVGEVGDVVAAAELRREDEHLDARRCGAAPRARRAGAACSAGRAPRPRAGCRMRARPTRCRSAGAGRPACPCRRHDVRGGSRRARSRRRARANGEVVGLGDEEARVGLGGRPARDERGNGRALRPSGGIEALHDAGHVGLAAREHRHVGHAEPEDAARHLVRRQTLAQRGMECVVIERGGRIDDHRGDDLAAFGVGETASRCPRTPSHATICSPTRCSTG